MYCDLNLKANDIKNTNLDIDYVSLLANCIMGFYNKNENIKFSISY